MATGRTASKRSPRDSRGARSVEAIADDRAGPGVGPGRALRQAQAYLALNARLRERIPANARGHIAIACVEDDCLVIAAASPARASQARLIAESLLAETRRHWPDRLARTRVIIAPDLNMER